MEFWDILDRQGAQLPPRRALCGHRRWNSEPDNCLLMVIVGLRVGTPQNNRLQRTGDRPSSYRRGRRPLRLSRWAAPKRPPHVPSGSV